MKGDRETNRETGITVIVITGIRIETGREESVTVIVTRVVKEVNVTAIVTRIGKEVNVMVIVTRIGITEDRTREEVGTIIVSRTGEIVVKDVPKIGTRILKDGIIVTRTGNAMINVEANAVKTIIGEMANAVKEIIETTGNAGREVLVEMARIVRITGENAGITTSGIIAGSVFQIVRQEDRLHLVMVRMTGRRACIARRNK